ncbi:DeoR/GlpR family DNA-binding transcription regulator [Planctomicrobium piriforme]|uniref:DNA-binding transcriptional regulator of sugar metabolism, DeoR/GlpR family n=1 Tax=Planctomicrobium piriforme TaxID=1576369 RepID=A0A1I3DI71_9PLAN|nr:DeoR/GlpR family DNA-binding transcription regulator [Planctomicrobium piriforme]SFH86191.1 DNA-binding transcriptional regulator of sugar metabolism, DeoR/GlpR family [Planctomicrobium piriforme]
MLLDQRRQGILLLVENKGFVSLREITEEIEVSESTARRDLEYLESLGQIRRTRGGAAFVGESLSGFDDRRSLAVREKQKIGKVAADLVGTSETIILDGGTTTLEVARHLAGKSLQVVTNSLPIVNHLVGVADLEVVFLGGYLYPKTGVALGELTVAALRQIHARRLIMGVGGITPAGLFNSNSLLVEAERQMMASADEIIVVADSTKLGHSELVRLCGLENIHRLIVDAGISEEWQGRLRAVGIDLIVVDDSARVTAK